MHSRARYILAVALVATALCAVRSTASVADARPQIGQLAEKLVARLTRGFRRTVPTVALFAERRAGLTGKAFQFVQTGQTAGPAILLSPFQIHLPPPLV